MTLLLVATEIVAYLIVAALLGFIAAWALRGALQRRRLEAGASVEPDAAAPSPTDAAETTRAQLAQRDAEIASLRQRLAALEQASHPASAEVLKTENYGDIPRFLEQLGIAPSRGSARLAAKSGADPLDDATGDLFAQEAAAAPVRSPLRDDLKKVHGIGPRFERTLNELGVHTYKQIALWRDEDIARYARELHTFPERLHRDEWVRSARKQHLLKYGERL